MPYLTIIAGPNGAGKSTISETLLSTRGIKAFDFDKEFYDTWRIFGFDPAVEAGVWQSASTKFIGTKSTALQNQINFAYETNYHTPDVLYTVRDFKAKGFITELIFIALATSEEAIERVKDRVAKGGHSVELDTVVERFHLGLQLLDQSFHQYDSFTLYLSTFKSIETLVHIEDMQTNKVGINESIPFSLRNKLPALCQYMSRGKIRE